MVNVRQGPREVIKREPESIQRHCNALDHFTPYLSHSPLSEVAPTDHGPKLAPGEPDCEEVVLIEGENGAIIVLHVGHRGVPLSLAEMVDAVIEGILPQSFGFKGDRWMSMVVASSRHVRHPRYTAIHFEELAVDVSKLMWLRGALPLLALLRLHETLLQLLECFSHLHKQP